MILIERVVAGLRDYERRDRAVDDASISRRQFELIARFESETGLVQHRAGCP